MGDPKRKKRITQKRQEKQAHLKRMRELYGPDWATSKRNGFRHGSSKIDYLTSGKAKDDDDDDNLPPPPQEFVT